MGLLHLSSLGKYFTHLTNVKVAVYFWQSTSQYSFHNIQHELQNIK